MKNEWIQSLKSQYNVERLKEEASKVGTELTYEEFRTYFKNKLESTESSKSGRHMGHYKACLLDDTFAEVIIHMINIPMICGFAAERWKSQ